MIPRQPDCLLAGDYTTIRPLREADLPEMAGWEPHKDPLLQDYNLSFTLAREWRRWLRTRLVHRWAYSIRNQDHVLVGHISLREIDFPWSSRLGISIAAAHVGVGYGSDALVSFLTHYFDQVGFEVMRLDVSAANERACHVYRKLGFSQIQCDWRSPPSGYVPGPNHRGFLRDGRLLHYEMELSATGWRRRLANHKVNPTKQSDAHPRP